MNAVRPIGSAVQKRGVEQELELADAVRGA